MPLKRRQFLSLSVGSVFALLSARVLANRRGPDNKMSNRTGFVYDNLYLKHWLEPGHPESPHRLVAIMEAMQQAQLDRRLKDVAKIEDVEPYIELIHSKAHMESIASNYPEADKVTKAVVAGALGAVQAVCSGQLDNAFCASRPPGHHAENTGRVEGFCFYNTIAIAARFAQQHFGLDKILIVDWDYHHGNGTESAFYSDPSVLFFSTHDLYAYPGTGNPERRGQGAGTGYNINVHLDCGANDNDIINAFNQYLLPAVESFKPDMILISAGFDSRKDDLLGCFDVTDDGFVELTRIVMQLADEYCEGRLVSILEGGYNLNGLASATTAHVRTLLYG